MHPNQHVAAPVAQDGAPLIGQLLQDALKEPNSPLSKDLKNALDNALIAKKAREDATNQHTDAISLELKIEELENELANERQSSHDKYIKAFETYYIQLELAIKNAQLSGNTHDKTSTYYALIHSLAIYVQALTLIENELVKLHNERESLLQSYANSQQACGVAFDKLFNNSTTPYVVGNNVYYLDITKVKQEKQAEAKEAMQNARNTITNPRNHEERMKILGPNHPYTLNIAKYGLLERDFFQIAMLNQIGLRGAAEVFVVESGQLKRESETRVKETTALAELLHNKLAPDQAKSRKIDHNIYHCNQKYMSVLDEKSSLIVRIDSVLVDIKKHPFAYTDKARIKDVNNLILTLNSNNSSSATPTMRPS